ncbi:MAG: hypothetical protein ABSG59_08195 [Verrucomicrobiota bacterium]
MKSQVLLSLGVLFAAVSAPRAADIPDLFLHEETTQRWTEEYQADLYQQSLRCGV